MSQQVFKFTLGVNNSVDVTQTTDATSLGSGVAAWLIVADNAVLNDDDITALVNGITHHIRDGQKIREAIQAA